MTASIDKGAVRESFCRILNENPRIMFSGRKKEGTEDVFESYFCDKVTPAYLEKLEQGKADIDFLCGVSAKTLPDAKLKKWLPAKSTKASEMLARNIISFDIDQKDNPDTSLTELSDTIIRNNADVWMIVSSGHGLHLHFALKPPVPLESDKDRARYKGLYQNLKAGLERELGIVFDKGAGIPSRTMRLPLSSNYKDPENPIATEVLHLNPDARLDITGLMNHLVAPCPLQAPVVRQSDGLRAKLRSILQWEVIFGDLGMSWASAKRSGNGWMISSPLREDKKPSMWLGDDGSYKDLGAPECAGDIVGFWADAKKMPYNDALKYLAIDSGIGVEDTSSKGQARLALAKSPHISKKDQDALMDGSLAIDEDAPIDQVAKKRQERKEKEGKDKKAQFSDYELLFDTLFGKTEIDLLSGELVYKPEGSDRWLPCATTRNLQFLKGMARANGDFYSVAAVEEYLDGRYAMIYKEAPRIPRILVDVPPWDGVDRIEKIVECLPLAELDHVTVYELFKDWGAKMWQRVGNPKIQNRLLLLKGAQNAGKDFLVDSMFSALEQYLVQLTISNQEKELFEIIASGVVMHISEYDRTNRTEVGLLKHIITAPSTTFRAAYARKAEVRMMRASFVATSNDNKALRDATGSRRFIYVELKPGEQIRRDYPINSPQVLAQFKALAGQKESHVSEKSERKLAKVLLSLQPEDFEDVICEEWEEATAQELDFQVRGEKAKEEMDKIAYRYKVGVNAVRGILRRRKYHGRTNLFKYWCKTPITNDQVEE